ncbi:MAG: hypothetical protein HQM14_09915 [SAR324 cluster bacterium]|nr:hypothetical protein [SAR324 cluster bacterium]
MVDKPLTREDHEFLEEMHNTLQGFMQSDEEILELASMNSYRRRLVHKVASSFKLKSHSVGDEERFVCLTKTEDSKIPEKKAFSGGPVHDFGMQTFYATPNTRIILRPDGSVGIPLKSERYAPLDDRIVTTKEFRVRKNKIVCFGEDGW